jgi:preprotein translocase subunit SecG
MNFWNQLRWIGSALFIALALLLVLLWHEGQDPPDSSPQPLAAQPAPQGNSHGL